MIHTCNGHHPQNNLKSRRRRQGSPEAGFGDLFAQCYENRFERTHPGTTKSRTLFIREVPVQGNGIADLMVLCWRAARKRIPSDLKRLNPTIRVFEFKMSDWRSGLMQAHRYKYFSHVAVLVLPKSKLKLAENHLDRFRRLRVGLWGFDPATESIHTVYTPRPKEQHSARRRDEALEAALRAIHS